MGFWRIVFIVSTILETIVTFKTLQWYQNTLVFIKVGSLLSVFLFLVLMFFKGSKMRILF